MFHVKHRFFFLNGGATKLLFWFQGLGGLVNKDQEKNEASEVQRHVHAERRHEIARSIVNVPRKERKDKDRNRRDDRIWK